jgi:Integrase core domain
MLAWSQERRITWHFIAPGKPMRTGSAFNGRMLNETIFYDLGHARDTLARWSTDYNQKRPHSALGYLTPVAFARTFTATADRFRNPDPPRRSPVAPPALWCQSLWLQMDERQGSQHRQPTILLQKANDFGLDPIQSRHVRALVFLITKSEGHGSLYSRRFHRKFFGLRKYTLQQ